MHNSHHFFVHKRSIFIVFTHPPLFTHSSVPLTNTFSVIPLLTHSLLFHDSHSQLFPDSHIPRYAFNRIFSFIPLPAYPTLFF